MALTARAQAFQGRTVEVTKGGTGIMAANASGTGFHVVRRIVAGERGTIVHVTDAGFLGLEFRIKLTTGERVTAYEKGVKVIR